MKLRNHWLVRLRQRHILKIVEWAHRQDRPVEELTRSEINEALRSYLREPSHA